MSWIETARVGDRIVCVSRFVRADRRDSNLYYNTPNIGSVYTIREIRSFFHGIYLMLDEVRNAPVEGLEPNWHYRGFRPVQTRPTDISVFTRLLKGKGVKIGELT